MTKFKNILLCFMFVLFSLPSLGAEKVQSWEGIFSFSNGFFTHQSTAISGTVLSLLSPDFALNYYLKPNHAIISGMDINLNFGEQTVSLIGLRVGYKWYYWGQGFYQKSDSPFLESQTQQRFSSYVGGAFKRYSYFLSNSFEAGGNFESSGSFYNFELLFGGDYMLTSKIKATSSLSLTLLSMAATDSRIKMTDKLVSVGLGYLF